MENGNTLKDDNSLRKVHKNIPVQISASIIATESHLQPLDIRRQKQIEKMEDRLAVVTVDSSCEALDQEKVGRVLQQRGPHTGRQLLQEVRPQLAPGN